MTSFDALSLSAPILRALEKLNFDQPTEIQAATIPALMEGHDVVGIAQTGGGKTAAFIIPMLERLAQHGTKPKPGMPRALILAPTRELALQITDKIKELSVGSRARCCTVYGGAPYRTQEHILRRGVDILIATPGRLKDHMKRGNIYLDETEYFVLDEADRMLDMGFIEEVRGFARKLPVGHQSVMFSATMNAKITELSETILSNPVRIEVAREATIADNLEHRVMLVPGHQKRDLLLHLIEAWQPEKSLIFVRTRRDADDVCRFMEAMGFTADAIHGDKKQKIRQRTINNFKAGRFDFLVATDVAARGIDVKDITHVFNMDVPVEAESYVHRIGRTARGEAHGKAVTFCGKNELNLLKAIEQLIQMKIIIDEDNPYPLKLDAGRKQAPRNNRRKGRKPAANVPAGKKRQDRTKQAPAARPSAKKTGKTAGKRVDPSANKRKAKAGAKVSTRAGAKVAAKAKKRPSVAARKAKALQSKSFKKPSGPRKTASAGGNQPLKRSHQ